jgi:3-hydroxyisobutyrate dehydrogenase
MSRANPIRKVAFLGTGLMGNPMVHCLLRAGIEVRVWNRTPDKLLDLVAAGAKSAPTPALASEGVDAVCLCLANLAAAESVLFGADGVASCPQPTSLVVDFSSLGPQHTTRIAGQMHQQCGTAWVDAPVSGGVPGATHGKLVVFCGGTESDISRLSSIFAALAQRVTRVGDVGAGQTLKLCNQLIVSSNLLAIAEAIALARASGIDANLLPGALAGGFADSIPLQVFGPRMAAGLTQPVLGAIALMLKDCRAIDELARSNDLQLPLVETTLAAYQRAVGLGLSNEDISSLITLYSGAKALQDKSALK